VTKETEIADKTERLQRMLAAEDLGGVLITSQHNFSWLTAGGSNGIDLTRESGAAAIFVRNDGKRYLLANRIEMPRLLAEEVSAHDFEPIEFPWEEEKAIPDFLIQRAVSLTPDKKPVGSDLPMGTACKVVESALAPCRYRLTTEEIERFRLLGRDAGQAIGTLARSVKPGQTEREILRGATDALAASNIYTVVGLAAADQRLQKLRHPLATELRWERALMIVVCARRHGLIVSLTRIVYAGRMPSELEQKTIAAATVNANLFAATRPGATGAELYEVAARAYAMAGFPGEERLHHQGGACGYSTRDWVAHPKASETVKAQQAFAWNPSITGTKTEETVIAFADRIETITSSPDWPEIRINIQGHDYSLPGVLSV